ncbi:MAG: gliding motility-associated C-terminal domain-containing protein, partial [Chitinophagales bacterium]|nr:gliding motility-associated C-terminal domain-containing protein [Chitinophagales bacterium]
EVYPGTNTCDSTQYYVVEVTDLPSASLSYELCEGDSLFFRGEWLIGGGVHDVKVSVLDGCDTLYEVTITEHQPLSIFDTLQLCEGDSVLIGDNWLSKAGWYYDTLPGDLCPVYSNILVGILENSYTDTLITLCPGDSVLLGNEWVKEPGEYIHLYNNAIGCDSLHRSLVNLIAMPPPPDYIVDCEALEVQVWINATPSWEIEWSNGDTSLQSTYVDKDTAYLSLSADPDCVVDYQLTLPSVPDIDLPFILRDTIVQKGSNFSLELDLVAAEWEVYWSPSSLFSCDTCLQTNLYVEEDVRVEVFLVHISGCTYEAHFQVKAEAASQIYVPNAFSPNDDGVNDYFQAFGNKIKINSFKIFDRWGGIMYESDGSSPSWDGLTAGKKASTGIYVYMITYTDLNTGKEKVISGDVVLIE